MHRDTQIGLAMAIVLIGFAAALGLPRESRETLATSPLTDAAALDARVNELPVRAYTDPPPELRPPGDRSTPPTGAGPGVAGTAAAPAPGSPRSDSEATRPAAPGASTPGSVEPVAATPPIAESPASEDEDQPAALATDTAAVSAGSGAAAGPEPKADLVHVVQEGDTLSELARRYLGSVARYPEIFEANRDQLRSPDDLRLHQRLRIPRRGPVTAGRP